MKTNLTYASFEGHPCVFDRKQMRGWVLFDRAEGWREFPFVEIQQYAGLMSEEKFKAYSNLPPLPSE